MNGMAWTTSFWLEIRVTGFVMYRKIIHYLHKYQVLKMECAALSLFTFVV